jgi:hypothetical protein
VTVTDELDWTGGTMSGPGSTTSSGVFNSSGSGTKTLSGRSLTNAGTATWTGTGGITVQNGAGLDNTASATFLIKSDTFLSSGPGTFFNEGTLVKLASSATTTIAIPFVNTGTVEVDTGTLRFSGAYIQNAGVTELAGGTLTAAASVSILGGRLSGSGTVNGDVINLGLVSPGDDGTAGVLTINGGYTQGETGVLLIDLGGLSAGTAYDQLVVSGTAALGGTLVVDLINDFQPRAGDAFVIVTYGSHNGTFTNLDLPMLGDDLTLTPDYGSTGVTLQTT